MNNEEFAINLSNRLGYAIKDTTELMNSLLSVMTQTLEEGNSISVQEFGIFEVKKQTERILVDPLSKQRMLIPPELVLLYKPSNAFNDKFK